MKLLPLLQAVLFAIGKKRPIAWIIDGNNLMGHRGTPKSPEVIADKLKPIQAAEAVILVFDGRKGEETVIEYEGCFQNVLLGEGLSADDYILQQIREIMELIPRRRVEVVTADRALRRKVLEARPTVRNVVNPVVFWRRYLPRLCGFKKKTVEVDETQ